MNKFQKKEAREVNKIINSSDSERMERLFFLIVMKYWCGCSCKKYNKKKIKDYYFKKIRRQYRRGVRNE